VALCLVLSAVAAGSHSIGYRPIYVEASPDHAGAISGVGNTIASLASVLGPITIGSSVQQQQHDGDGGKQSSWVMAGFWMWLINILGCLAALTIVLWSGGGGGGCSGYRWWLQHVFQKERGQQERS